MYVLWCEMRELGRSSSRGVDCNEVRSGVLSRLPTWMFLLCLWASSIAGALVSGGTIPQWLWVAPAVVLGGEICNILARRQTPAVTSSDPDIDIVAERERQALREIGQQRRRDMLALRDLEQRLVDDALHPGDLGERRQIWLMELQLWAQGNDLPQLTQRIEVLRQRLTEMA